MRNYKVNKMVNYGIEELEKIAPMSSVIELDVKEDPIGHFSSLIKVKAKKKVFFVKKEGDSMYESFHKAMRALKIQLSKAKNSHQAFRKLQYQDF